jgi:hypothetical protein
VGGLDFASEGEVIMISSSPNGTATPQRILVVSTPKTGNTWLLNLLSAIYRLPKRDVGPAFCEAAYDALGPRWIAQQHVLPTSSLVEWAKANGAAFVTAIRHPGDVLVSLCHYALQYRVEAKLQQALEHDGGEFGRQVAAYVRDDFFLPLNISISWIRSGLSHVVRYEDLWRDPATVLRKLTQALGAVPAEAIERAILRCEFDLMREIAGDRDGHFFRKGRTGGWRSELPPAIIQILAEEEPFPSQFAILGYTMDLLDVDSERLVRFQPRPTPFRELHQFDNGVPVRPILVDLYLSFPTDATRNWDDLASTDPDHSFFAWLNAPSPGDGEPMLSNLAMHIYNTRLDLQLEYPSLEGMSRAGFALWFLENAAAEYDLDEAFICRMAESFQKWSMAPVEPEGNDGLPVVTKLGACMHGIRRDLQCAFPDLYGRHRIDFAEWFIHNAQQEYGVGREQILPVILSWAEAGPVESVQAPRQGSHLEGSRWELLGHC